LRIIGGALTDMCRSEPLESTSFFSKRSISAVGPEPMAGMLERLSVVGGRLGMAGARSRSASMMFAEGGALMP
jgi:hypothetical protein